MVFKDWVLPILIGSIAAFILISILYTNNTNIDKIQNFTDIRNLIQLQKFNTKKWLPLEQQACIITNNNNNHNNTITTFDSPLNTDETLDEPIYNYYPQTPIV